MFVTTTFQDRIGLSPSFVFNIMFEYLHAARYTLMGETRIERGEREEEELFTKRWSGGRLR